MKTKNKFIVSTLVFILLELTCFVLLSASKNILGFNNIHKPINLLTLVSSIPFIFLYFYVLTFIVIVCFKKANNLVFHEVWELYKKNIFFLVLLRLSTDITTILFVTLFEETIIAKTLFETIFIFATFLLIIRRSEQTKNKIALRAKITMSVILISLIVIGILYIIKCYDYKNIINHYYQKYDNVTENLFVNVYTKIDLLNVYISVFVYFCAFSFVYTIYGKDTYKKYDTRKSVFIYRVNLVFSSFLIYIIAFCLISPYGSLCGFDGHSLGPIYTSDPKSFEVEYYDKYFYRKRDYGWHTYNTYTSEKVVIKYGNDVLFTYEPLIPIELSPSLEEINGGTSYTYENKIIVYFDDEIPKAILVEEITKQEENHNLTHAVKNLILEDNFEFFEYGCEYLLKYNKDFIVPIIIDYSDDGLLSDKEIDDNIYKQYKIDFSKKIIKKFDLL